MSKSTETYFPADGPDWNFVQNEFPFPLAVTCVRLLAEMERQEPIAAAWALRDALECLVKFSASLAVADLFQASPNDAGAAETAQLLLKPSGLSVGDWHTLLEAALRPLGLLAQAGQIQESGRVLPGLLPVFFSVQGKLLRTSLNRRVAVDPDSFVAWRNRVFGHGVFSEDRRYYAEETLLWLPVLGDFYAALRPVLAGRQLVSRTPGGDEVVWQGADGLPPTPRHEHEPWGDPLPMFLAAAPGFTLPSLPLTPFLSVQQCQSCGQPAAFFFDKNKFDRKHDRHSTTFLEYFSGHPGFHKDWTETRRIAGLLPPTFNWERTIYDGEEVDGNLGIVFRDFDAEYLRPDYLLDAVWQIIEKQPKGYIHLIGPGGMGKTYFMRGLAAEGPKQGAAVLSYHILPGARTDARTFLPELNAYARDTLRSRTQEPQMRGNTAAEMQAELVSYLSRLKAENSIDLLIVALDALDELTDPTEQSACITDFLPPTAQLPDGCFFVLTSRQEMRPKVRADVARLQAASPEAYATLSLGAGDVANERLLRAYLSRQLPASLKTPQTVEAVLARCGGIFLYAFHLCHALEAGVFPDALALPDGAEFYPAYLDRLRDRVGDHLYESVYLPILMLLCAAQQPVTLDQLTGWGVPRDRLQFALLDLRDFLRVHRELPWQDRLGEPDGENRFEIAHEAFVRYVQTDTPLAKHLLAAHSAIARHALAAHGVNWRHADPSESAALYDLRYVLPHLEYAGMAVRIQILKSEAYYATACISSGLTAYKASSFLVADALWDIAITILLYFCKAGRMDVLEILADALLKKGSAQLMVGYVAKALTYCEEGLGIYRLLVRAGRADLRVDMAMALCNISATLVSLGRSEEALTYCDESLDVYQPLIQAGRTDLLGRLGCVLINRGNTLEDLGRPEEALTCWDESIRIHRPLVLAGRADIQDKLTDFLMNRGNALIALGRAEEALICYDEGIKTCRLLAQAGQSGCLEKLTVFLMNRGYALSHLGRLEEALTYYDESLSLRRSLTHVETKKQASFLAGILMNKFNVLKSLGRLAEASACYDEANALRE